MATSYQINVHDAAGILIDVFDQGILTTLDYVFTENDVGVMTLTIPRVRPWELFQVDRILTIQRNAGAGAYVEGERAWFLRDWALTTGVTGNEYYELVAYDSNYLLDSRIVAYNAGSANALWSGEADDVMKDIVRYNLGSSATDTARRLAGLTIAGDLSLAQSIEKAGSRDNVLELLKEIAESSWERGTYLAFDTVYTGAGTFEFRTYTGQRGNDHSSDSGDPRVVMLATPRLEYLRSEERNYIYAGGRGKEDARIIKTATDATWTGASRWNRRELFADARGADTEASVEEDARANLYENRPRRVLSGMLQDTDGLRYGVDYGFGDIVACKAFDVVMDCHVNSVHVSFMDGAETIDIMVRGEE